MIRAAVAILLGSLTMAPDAAAEVITGDQGLKPVRLKYLSRRSTVDLTGADFFIAPSRNDAPTRKYSCRQGPNRLNRYPMAVEKSFRVRIVGGRFDGNIPMGSDWRWTYCNSAALRVEDSEGALIQGQRIRRTWDGIRIDDDTHRFRISGVWMSDTRDDCVENDKMLSGEIRDSLFDRCFAGISMAPTNNIKRKPRLLVDGVLLRLDRYLYKGDQRHTMPFKTDGRKMRIDIRDSVFALEASDLIGAKYAKGMWRSIGDCSNNLLLWLNKGPLPQELRLAPDCFRVLRGDAAYDAWNAARRNWINCHPRLRRFPDDTSSRPGKCRTDRFGGLAIKR